MIVALTARVDDLNLQLVAVIEKQIKLFAETHAEVIKYEKEKLVVMQEQGELSAQQHSELMSVLSKARYDAPAQAAHQPQSHKYQSPPTALPIVYTTEGGPVLANTEEATEKPLPNYNYS